MSETVEQKILGKMDILRIKTLKKQLVPVPEWGGSVWIQEMTAAARDNFDNWVVESKKDRIGMRARIVVATAIDEEGKPIFSELDIQDLLVKSSDVIVRLADVGMELSGMNEAAKVEAVKNSEAALKEDSPSDSPLN